MPKELNLKRELSPKQVYAEYHIPVGTLASWRSKGKGPSFEKRDGRIIYTIGSIQDWFDTNLKRLTEASGDYEAHMENTITNHDIPF